MDKEKQIINKDTRILGTYETATVIWQSDTNGDYHRTFDDTFIIADEQHHRVERVMDIEGRVFKICSVFPIKELTPTTQKLLSIIDYDLAGLRNAK